MTMQAEKVEAEAVPDTSKRGNYPAPAHSFALRLDDELALRLIERHHAHQHFERIDAEREHLGRWLSWTREPTAESVTERVHRSLQRFAAGDGWRAELCWRSEPIGSIWLHGLDGPGGSTEVGYWISATHQGKGLITRSLRALLRHFFTGRGLERVSIGLDPANERSLAVVKRLGLQPEAVLRRILVDADGAATDLAMFGLLRADWEEGEGPGPVPLPRFCLEVDADEELYLGLFEREDAEQLAALVAANAEHLRPWMPWVDGHGREAQLAFITGRALPAIAAGAGFEAGVWSAGRLVGAAGVHSVDERSRSGVIGYWLDASEQGKGIVTRLVRAVTERSFTERVFGDGPFERLEISADVTNLRSRAVAERLGFSFEGVLRRQPFGAGKYIDLAIYSLLRSEWEAIRGDVPPASPLSENAVSMEDEPDPHESIRSGAKEQAMTNQPDDKRREGLDRGEPTGRRHDADDDHETGSEGALDEALDDTFPASDPPSHEAPRADDKAAADRAEREGALDEALDDTFPASDPVSQTAPHRDHDDENGAAS